MPGQPQNPAGSFSCGSGPLKTMCTDACELFQTAQPMHCMCSQHGAETDSSYLLALPPLTPQAEGQNAWAAPKSGRKLQQQVWAPLCQAQTMPSPGE